MGMNVNAVIHCLKDTTAIDCLACPYFAERKGSITSCRMQRFGEAREIVEKYQKIEKIMHKEYTHESADMCLVYRLSEIREVLEEHEDGNN